MISALQAILERAQNARNNGGGYLVSCPCPDHGKGRGDKNPSVSIGVDSEGNALVHCHAGCATEDIVAEWDLTMADLYEQGNGKEGVCSSVPPRSAATVQPCTLETYAEAKGLPIPFLQSLGLSNMYYMGTPALRISYMKEDGTEEAVRFRLALEKSPEHDNRFRWRKGSKPFLYGLWRLGHAREAGYVFLAEGESDCHSLWHYGFPALGVPGANSWRNEWAEKLDGIAKLYAVVEPDRGGEAFWERLAASPIRQRLYRVELEVADEQG